ncbi:MAG TPA: hypothetical protein VJT72_13935 [Pseudonocardiaceae bacterium]|nr:hypothetical protein [Pseudonocardiaceae bacterium]
MLTVYTRQAGAAIEAYQAAGLTVEILRHNPAFARLRLTDGQGGQVRVEMGIDWRAHPPVTQVTELRQCLRAWAHELTNSTK